MSTSPQGFSDHVCEKLGHYVYRLIDPRDGAKFYVGRGQGNRVFDHAAGRQAPTDSESTQGLKLKIIGEIRNAGLEVQHVIHRHGMDETCAREVEAALIDAFPGLTNVQPGDGSDERGVMHAVEVVTEYEAPIAQPEHKLLLIKVNRTSEARHNLYDDVRYAWKIDHNKASLADYVLAVRRGLIIGAFVADKWLPATAIEENFPTLLLLRESEGYGHMEGRYGFLGKEAPEEIKKLYCLKRIPDSLRRRGAAAPVRYWNMY
jgi:hypothetical protein